MSGPSVLRHSGSYRNSAKGRSFLSTQGLAVALLLGCTLPASGQATQTAAPDSTAPDKAPSSIQVNVNVVNVPATVRDKHGKIVGNLTKDDFVLSEDGHPQTVRYFAHENQLPLTLGLLVDTSLSQRRVLGEERDASQSFLDQMVREDKDKAFVIHFDREVELLQDLTASHEKLEAAINSLQTPELKRAGSTSGDPDDTQGSRRGRMGMGGGTELYDAVYLASDELMKKQQGRKALIVLSDGVDNGSKESLASAVEAAQRADTVVYSILFKDDEEGFGRSGGFGYPGGGIPGMGGPGGGMGRHGGGGSRPYPREERPDGKKILERISTETGGRLFEASKKQPLDQIYGQIEEELRNQYNLGYTPNPTPDAGHHKIQLTVKDKGMTVQAREGYYSGQ